MKKLLICVIFILFAISAFAQEIYPSNVGSLEAIVTIYGNGAVSDLKEGQEVKLQTITFQENEFQKILEVKEELTMNGRSYGGNYLLDEFNNKYVLFTISENGSFNYKITARVKTNASILNVPDYEIRQDTNDEIRKAYLKPTEKIESNSIEIITLTKNKIGSENYITTVDKTVNWVNDYVDYATGTDFSKYYLTQKSAIETLLSKKGVCDEFANLGAAILRVKKIPTQINIGITFDGKEWGNHAWIGTYNELLNMWIPSDPTFRESGFVDATHIKMGSFSDITESQAKAVFPSNSNVSFDTQTKLPDVNIISIGYFGEVMLEMPSEELKANKWNKIKIKATNISSGKVYAPISLQKNYKEILVKENRKTLELEKGETGEVEFEIYPQIKLESNQIAKGIIRVNSLSKPLEKEVVINAGTYDGSGEVVVEDITPIAHEGVLQISTTISNFYPENKEIDINIFGGDFSSTEKQIIPSFSSQTSIKEIPNYSIVPYSISITTPTAQYTQTIGLEKQKITIEPKQIEKKSIVEQKIGDEKNTTEAVQNNPIVVLVGILIGVTILLFALLWVNKKYV